MPVPAGFNAGWPSYAFSGGQIAMLSII